MLTDLDGNEVSTSITDIAGRYGFLMAPGSYRMVANKTNYEFPSKRLAGQIADELYGNLYFGSDINVDEQNAVIAKNIPMDPVNFDWNEYAKTQNKKLMKFYSRFDVWFMRIINFLFILGPPP